MAFRFVLWTMVVILVSTFDGMLAYTSTEDQPPPLTTASTTTSTTTSPTSTTTPNYPPILNPYMEIELQGNMYASYVMTMSCANDYSKQFQQTLKGELDRAKQEMLASTTFCPGLSSVVLNAAYVNMVASGVEVYLTYGVDIFSYGANTLDSMSSCAWQLSAYLSEFSNWRQPIWTDIHNCPRLAWNNFYFIQNGAEWICP